MQTDITSDKRLFQIFIQFSPYLMAAVSLAVMMTFILLGQYAHPSADDFCMASGVKNEGLFPHLWQHYQEWSGRYSGNAFYGIYPLIFGMDEGYRFMPVLVILLLFTAFAFFLSKLFKTSINSYPVVFVSLCFVSVFLLGMVSTASSLFWMAGALTYQTANILLLIMLGLLIQLRDFQKLAKDYTGTLLGLGLVVFLGIGTNENSLLTFMAVLLLGFIIHLKSGWVILKPWLFLLVLGLFCFAVVYFSPGTTMRESTFPLRHNLTRAISGSLEMGLWTLKIWLSSPVLLLASVLAPFAVGRLYHLSERTFTVSKSLLAAMIVLTFSIPVILQFPAWWGMGGWPPPRTVDAIFFVFLFNWFLTIGAATIRYMPKHFMKAGSQQQSYTASTFTTILMLTGVVFFILAVLDNNKFQRAQHDLLQRAKPYHEYMLQRKKLINNALQHQQLALIVPDFKLEYPRSIYFNDILPFSRDWRNVCYADYYGLDRIKRKRTRKTGNKKPRYKKPIKKYYNQ